MERTFYEFFAGARMARAGLGDGWKCLFANDIDLKKSATYEENWKDGVIKPADVKDLKTTDLPIENANLVWASFPCQDLSLAGAGAGLKGDRSGTFWPFWRLMTSLINEGRAPEIITLENVAATLTSHGGKDFEALCRALVSEGYRVGARVTVREGARLMGLPDTYVLPDAYNEGYHLVGDGVAVGVVRYLTENIFEHLIDVGDSAVKKAA